MLRPRRHTGRRSAILYLAALLPALAGACSSSGCASGSGGASGRRAPEISGTTLDGKPWRLADLRGSNTVILAFFATWCGPCAMEIPHLIKMQSDYEKQGLNLVLLTEEPAATLKKFEFFTSLKLPVVVNASDAFEQYRVSAIPRTVVVDSAGSVIFDHEGASPETMERLRSLVAQAVGAPAGAAEPTAG